MIDIIIAYALGTSKMLECCLNSLYTHNAGEEYFVILATDNEDAAQEASAVSCDFGIGCQHYDVGPAPTGSGRHARILDGAFQNVCTEKVLTLDSDCLVVADDWLKDMSDMIDNGATVAGALWPWIPPPDDMNPSLMEHKIRRFHNWNYTHVACQMVKTSFLRENNIGFSGPYDTGLGIPNLALEKGLKVTGWKPTCCANPDGDFDAEFNRLVCIIYGDKIYHHGGASRQAEGKDVCWKEFDSARNRVLDEKSADWILKPENCYRYRFDREEEVAEFKMQMHYAAMQEYLKTHVNLFGESWY